MTVEKGPFALIALGRYIHYIHRLLLPDPFEHSVCYVVGVPIFHHLLLSGREDTNTLSLPVWSKQALTGAVIRTRYISPWLGMDSFSRATYLIRRQHRRFPVPTAERANSVHGRHGLAGPYAQRPVESAARRPA